MSSPVPPIWRNLHATAGAIGHAQVWPGHPPAVPGTSADRSVPLSADPIQTQAISFGQRTDEPPLQVAVPHLAI